HNFYECHTTIMGRYNMGADGFYDYISKDGRKNTVKAHEIKVDYVAITALSYATGYDTMGLMITPRFMFKGVLLITVAYRVLDFNGYVHPIHALKRPSSGWWRDHKKYVPDSVLFHINNPENEDKKPLKLGLWITIDSVHTYPGFFTLGRNYSDSAIINVNKGI